MSVIPQQLIDKLVNALEEMKEDETIDGFAGAFIGYASSGERCMILLGHGRISEKRLREGFGAACEEFVEKGLQGASPMPHEEGKLWN